MGDGKPHISLAKSANPKSYLNAKMALGRLADRLSRGSTLKTVGRTAFTVPQEIIAADGSKLYFDGAGTVELIPLDNLGNFTAEWVGEFTVVGGTRRFANAGPAAEPLQVIAMNDPFNFFTDPVWTFSWEVTGEIDLGRRSP